MNGINGIRAALSVTVGMVEALKTYSGDTITDKFYNFAVDCGVSADTITSFRNLMLE